MQATMLKPVDVVIVGGGWVGLSMAREIATRTSLSVLVLERGVQRSPSEYAVGMDEVDYAFRHRLMQNAAEETITHRHSMRATAVPVRQYGSFLPGSGVGGAGEHWAGVSFRYLPDVFTLRSHLTRKHGAAKLPNDLAVQDWGITYGDLEPHYWRAEQMLGVGGKAGNLNGKVIPGGNPFEGPRSHEYPLPPSKRTYLSSLFIEATQKLGYHPYPAASALLTEPYTNPDGIVRPACVYCGYCVRYGCMIGAKAQPSNTLLPILQKRKNFELRAESWVRRIRHKNGRITGVEYTDARGRTFVQPASIVVLASYTLNNVRLLYLSKIGTPYDPIAGKGTLGRNLTHQVQAQTSVYFEKPLNNFMSSGASSTWLADFDGDHGLDGSEGILRLGGVQSAQQGDQPIATFGLMPVGSARSHWGSAWKSAAVRWYDRRGVISLAGEHLAWRQHYMDLDPTYTDKFGDPLLRFTLDWTVHEHRQREAANRIAKRIAPLMGGTTDDAAPTRTSYDVRRYQSSHIQGGAVMGTSPAESVVSRNLQHWNLPDLWVIGASAFPQNASHNPTLTVLAVTTWAADALIDRYLKSPGHIV
jgi:gluconate 2-dehydrogenase alpha chain